jgi:hypothetical protein
MSTVRKESPLAGVPRAESTARARERYDRVAAFLLDPENVGRTVPSTARILGVPEHVVDVVRRRLGFDARHDLRRRIQDFLLDPGNAGLTDTEVARRLGCTRPTVTMARLIMEARPSRTLDLATIRVDGGTSPRAKTDRRAVDRYAAAMEAGAKFPPVVVFYDGTNYWLADGYIRYCAARRLDLKSLAAEIRMGDRRDAALYAAGANIPKEWPRTAEDKRRAVAMMLRDPEWKSWPREAIARHCGVTPAYVRDLKKDLDRRAALDAAGGKGGDDGSP